MHSGWTQFGALLHLPLTQASSCPATHSEHWRWPNAYSLVGVSLGSSEVTRLDDKCDHELYTLSCRFQGSLEGFKTGKLMVKVVFAKDKFSVDCRKNWVCKGECVSKNISTQEWVCCRENIEWLWSLPWKSLHVALLLVCGFSFHSFSYAQPSAV